MATAAIDATSERCGMCLGDWSSRRDIRALPCRHTFCITCLDENQLLHKRTVCPNCRHDHGKLDLESLEVVYREEKIPEKDFMICGTDECDEISARYCLDCKQHYCPEHLKLHSQLFKSHELLELSEFRSRKSPSLPAYCEIHPNHALVVACEKCYVMKCDHCEDQAKERCAKDERHSMWSLGQVAGPLSSDIRRKLDELKDKESHMFDKLKDVLSQGDKIEEDVRSMLSGIDDTASHLKAKIDQQADALKQEVVDYHKEIKLRIEVVTNNVNGFADDSSNWSELANEILRRSNAEIVGGYSDISDKAGLILNAECARFTHVLKTLRGPGIKETQNFPLSLALKILPPSAVRLKSSLQTPSYCYSLTHLTTGQLVHGGSYTLTGCEFDVQIEEGFLFSLYEHSNCLYLLRWTGGFKNIHVLNLSTGDCTYSVIKYKEVSAYPTSLVVNDQHIITVCVETKLVKVFSSTDFSFQYDIELDCLAGCPYGIAQLPDGSLVVSDFTKGLVCNFNVDRNPAVNWICKDLAEASPITIDNTGDSILVGSFSKKLIYVLSFTGEKIRSISLSECTQIRDMSITDNELAVAAEDGGVELYELIR